MAIPTNAQWSSLKSGAGIAKSPWWKPADAAVGPALKKLDSAKAEWKSKKDLNSARSYLGALKSVHDAFQKFLKKKDLSAAGNMESQIEGWMKEVETKHGKLQSKLPALKEQNKEQLLELFSSELGI